MIESLWQKWLTKRFQYTAAKQLKQKDVLVFIYKQGYLFAVLILITFAAGVNYANNLILGFCFLIGAVLCISFYLTFKQLHGLTLELNAPEAGDAGRDLYLDLMIQQPSRRPRYLWIQAGEQLHKVYVSELKQQVRLNFLPERRGCFRFPAIQLYAVYPFGLVRAWSYLYLNLYSWIAPQPAYPEQENKHLQHSFEPDLDEFRELRDFKTGDSLQAVSWKQAARGQGLYVKVFEQFADQHRIEIDYAHMPSAAHEDKLSMMMGLALQCEQQQIAYAVYLPQAELSSGLGEAQLHQVKLMLAQA